VSNQQPPQDDLVQMAELARLQAEVADAEAQAALAKAAAARLQARALELETKLRPAQSSAAVTTAAPLPTGGITPGRPRSGSARLAQSTAVVQPTVKVPSAAAAAQTSPPSKNEGRESAMSAAVPVRPETARLAERPHVKNGNGSATRVALAPAESTLVPPSQFGLPPRILRMSVAIASSMFVHLALIVVLGLWFLPQIIKSQDNELVATLPETPEDMVNQLLDERLTATDALSLVNASSSTSSQVGQAGQGGESGGVVGPGEPTFDKTVAESGEGPPVNATITLDSFEMPGGTLNEQVSDLALGEPLAVVDSYQEAMDRITQEILNMLSKNKVLVIWCFDQSLSMKDDQKEIRERIAKVYAELGLAESAKGGALLTAVTSFGKTPMENLPDPTGDIDKIRAAIESVPVDESGLEMMCQAVHDSIQQYRRFATGGRRQIALILVSDESGDEKTNLAHLEETIAMAKQYHCPVYVLGREAVFGYPYAHMWWTVTVPAQGGGEASNTYLVAVDRGPESPFVEQLQTDGFGRRQDAHPSGFGPYDQVRLARETGGIFFMLPSPESQLFNRDNRKYEIERMRPYLPDLRARDVYSAERDSKPLRNGVWRVINELNPYHEVQGKYINMRMTFSIDRGAFAREVLIELEKAKQYFLYLDMVENQMDDMRRARDQDASPRWQANYDLMFAQILAYKVRLFEYGAYLQEFIKKPRPAPPNEPKKALSHWAVVTRQETITGETTRPYIQRSKAMFEEVVRYHPGTPWAARAQWEMQRGFGVELAPQFYDPTYKPPIPVKPFVAPKL